MCIRDSIQTGQYMYAGLNGIAPDNKAIPASVCSLMRNIDDQINLMTQNQIQNIGRFLLQLLHSKSFDSMII